MGLVEKLAVGACGYDRIQVQEISDDESSIELNATCLFGSPNGTQASSCNQSMDDVEDEEVHDWLAEMSSTSTTLFTSTNSCGDERQQALKPTYSLKSKPSSFGYRTLSEHHHITAVGPDLNAILASPKQTGKQSCNDKHIVKDTIHVERRHAPLPSKAPPATTGNWLTNRYCVNDYIVLSQIGKGAHAEVRLCKHKKSNELFAVKIMNRKLLQSKSTVDIQKEVKIMKKLRHPNILRLYEVIDDPKVNKVFLVTEFAQGGDLMNIIKQETAGLNDDQLQNIVRQIMDGLLHLHQNNICHNDLKPSNLLVNGDGTVQIADFGISGTGRVRLDSAGTPAFMSPEVVSGEPHDGQLADCYALGATIFWFVYKRPPFIGKGGKNQKLLDLYNQIKDSPLLFPGPLDTGLRDLISRLMQKDLMHRLRLLEAIRHPWLVSNAC